MTADPHLAGKILTAGPPPEKANYAAILLHGRGAPAAGMLALGEQLALPDIAFLAPEAAHNTWWPHSFLAPLPQNEPHITSAIATVHRAVTELGAAGVAPSRILLAGFSQGACLAIEYAARHPAKFLGVVAMSGGLIGTADNPLAYPDEALHKHREKHFGYEGRLDDVHVSLSVCEKDPHIPLKRVHDTSAILTAMGARVETYTQPGIGHSIFQHDIRMLRHILNDG
ncbi:MAG: phospholipase [Pseudomonadota bacterium]